MTEATKSDTDGMPERDFHQTSLAAKLEAARAMLKALEEAQEHVGVVRLQTGFDVRPIQERVRDAIAAAHPAGIGE